MTIGAAFDPFRDIDTSIEQLGLVQEPVFTRPRASLYRVDDGTEIVIDAAEKEEYLTKAFPGTEIAAFTETQPTQAELDAIDVPEPYIAFPGGGEAQEEVLARAVAEALTPTLTGIAQAIGSMSEVLNKMHEEAG